MKKKLSLLLMLLCFLAMVGCDSCASKEKFTVTYNAVTVTENELPEDAEEDAVPTYTYEVSVQGTEVVEEGSKITGVALGSDGKKYIAGIYYTAQEVNVEDTPQYDAEAEVTGDLVLYADVEDFAEVAELATGTGYTLNYAISEFPTTWNSHIYQTNTDATILDYIQSGLYQFDYNENKDGFVWADDMATGDPVDVTANYVGEAWGIAEGDTARAWEITLRDNLKWDDGTEINAKTFIDSAIRLLNPAAANSRADDYTYSGNLKIHNAENYLLQGSNRYMPYGNYYATYAEAIAAGYTVELNLTTVNSALTSSSWFGSGATLDVLMRPANYANYIAGFFTIYTDGADGTRVAVTDAEGNAVTFFDKYNVLEATDNKIEFSQQMWEDYTNCDDFPYNGESGFGALCSIYYEFPQMDFSSVGIKQTAPNKIVYIIDQELSGFYLKYSLSNYIVKTDLYDANDNLDSNLELPEGQAVYNSTYCTSVETTPSCGPYKLVEYQLNKYIRFEKNENWYGYALDENEGLYQTTAVVYTKADSAATRLQMFLSGLFDSYGLQAADMDEYQTSDYTYFNDGESTWFIAMNPSADAYLANEYDYTADAEGNPVRGAHKNIDKQILSIQEFRMALSFSLDRASYQLACDPTGNVAKALFSPLIVANPETGSVYRNTPAAKQAIVEFWGVADQIGAGKLYETVDDAIDAITGYNLSMAKDYFNQAYDLAVEAGYIDADDVVEILIGTPNTTSNYYNRGYAFLTNCWTDAVQGTKLEGKLTFRRDGTLGNAFGNYLRDGRVDMLFGVGFSGSALDPYGLIEVYTTWESRYNTNRDFTKVDGYITLPRSAVEAGYTGNEEATYLANVAEWTSSLNGTEITVTKVTYNSTTGEYDSTGETYQCSFGTTVDYDTRGIVLAGVELYALSQYDLLPIAYESSATLKGMKIKYYTEEYIFGLGRGGIKYLTFNYNDAEWAAFVASQGGKLNYKVSTE